MKLDQPAMPFDLIGMGEIDAYNAGRREQARVDQEVVKGLWVRGRNDPIVGTELVVAQAKYGVLKALREAAPKED